MLLNSIKIAFIGLGVMGYPMAGHLAQAGHRVTVYNRTQEKADRWVTEHTGQQARTPAEAVQGADVVMACVGNDEHLRAVTLGEQGAFQAMKPGTVFVDHTTASAIVARELADSAKQQRFHFLDAPVSGGQAGAENGILTIMVGGEQQVFERVAPLLRAYARMARLMGPVGSGQLTKMVNQICVAGLLQALSEGLHFAELAGLDGESVIDVISKGAAQSWQMDNRYKSMLAGEFDFGFAVDWMRKDLAIIFEEAKLNGAHLPVTEQVDHFYAQVQDDGGHRWDTSSLISLLRKRNLE